MELFEQSHGNALIEIVHQIQQSIIAINRDDSPKSPIVMSMNKWHIQNAIRDCKEHIMKMILDFNVGRDLQNCIDKLNESMVLLIGVYDQIDEYSEKAKLASYIANIASAHSQPTRDSEYNDVICQLTKMIKTNLILEQYEIAMNAFKQHKFPFAHCYLSKFEMPESLKFDDVDGLKQIAIEKIEALKADLEYTNVSIEKYDEDIVSAEKLKFYTWHHNDIKDDIGKLLQGEEVTLKADIAKGMNENAVKFKKIEIFLKLRTAAAQQRLNEKLESFKVVMTMVGNSYYRCGKRSYCMAVDDKIVIKYSIKKNDKGEPDVVNEVYNKIRDGYFFLSPYTMWTIKLVGDFTELNEFKNEIIDLQLQGSGQYVKHSSNIENEFVPHVLDKYYDFSGIISFVNDKILINP